MAGPPDVARSISSFGACSNVLLGRFPIESSRGDARRKEHVSRKRIFSNSAGLVCQTVGRRPELEKIANVRGKSGEPGGNRTHNSQIRVPSFASIAFRLLLLGRNSCDVAAISFVDFPSRPRVRVSGRVSNSQRAQSAVICGARLATHNKIAVDILAARCHR